MIKKIIYVTVFLAITSCASVKEKTGDLKEMGSIGKECPPKEERTLKHIFCKEPK